jgi:hypothetical protein
MESLAVLVMIIFFSLLACGPMVWAISLFVPVWLGKFLAGLVLVFGIWWLSLPIGPARLFSVPTLIICIRVLQK